MFRALACVTISIFSLSTVAGASLPEMAIHHARSVGINPAVADAASRARVNESYGQLPLSFEVNQGQADPQVKFLARGAGQALFLTSTEAVLVLTKADPKAQSLQRPPTSPVAPRAGTQTVLRMTFAGASPQPPIAGQKELAGKVNYFLGNDPAKWRTNVPTYAAVRYEGLYPGIDLVYYGNYRQLEYDLIVAPGADPSQIALSFKGADRLEVDGQGDLVLYTAVGAIRQRRPLIYQELADGRREIAGGYVLKGAESVGFQVAAHDTSRSLIIDPGLVYSTHLGANYDDFGNDIAVDATGNAYVTGSTRSPDFPTTPGAFRTTLGGPSDVFVTKLNPSGSGLVYSTYLGGSDYDYGYGIAVDTGGNAYVTGTISDEFSGPPDFPTTPGAFQPTSGGGVGKEAFVTKLNPSGSALVYSTYLGGYYADEGLSICVDATGNAYVTGYTNSSNFPTTAGVFQTTYQSGYSSAFVTKLNPGGSALVYSTYLGGAAANLGYGIAVDAAGNAYVTGSTTSNDFPTTPGAIQVAFGGFSDAFVTKVNPDGSGLIYSTYLGGTTYDSGYGIAVDAGGNAYVTGSTSSTNFPTTPGAFQTATHGYDAVFCEDPWCNDAFVTKLNASGSGLVYSTYLGGIGHDFGEGIAVDFAENAYVTGVAASPDFPTTPGASQTARGGFATKLNPVGSALVYSTTHLSSSGLGIAVDAAGSAYITGPTAFVTKIGSTVSEQIEAEDFDLGGEGVAYHDLTPGNQGGQYRTSEDVDIIRYPNGAYVVNNFQTGEWLQYTIQVPRTGTYRLELLVSRRWDVPSRWHAEIDNQPVTSSVVVPDTGSWDTFWWVGVGGFSVTAGTHVLRIAADQEYFNFAALRLLPNESPFAGTPAPVPGQIEAEDFDHGGEGVAYHDLTPGNQGGQYRTDVDVDIIRYPNGAYVVNNFQTGEWLQYTIQVPQTGTYRLELLVSRRWDVASRVHVEVDNQPVTGSVVVPDTGSWDTFWWVTVGEGTLTAGTHVLRIVADQEYFNFAAFRLLAE